MASLLQVKDLKTYFYTDDGVVKAVDGISYDVEAGEIMGLVGESGCGKTVSALSILRLIPNPPGRIVEGQILFDGEDLAKAAKAIQEAESALAGKSNDKAAALIAEAHALVAAMPIVEADAVDKKYPGVFTSDVFKKRKKASVKVPPRQAEFEEKWDAFAKKNYADAAEKAKQALALLN